MRQSFITQLKGFSLILAIALISTILGEYFEGTVKWIIFGVAFFACLVVLFKATNTSKKE